jgi:hypothetical protein
LFDLKSVNHNTFTCSSQLFFRHRKASKQEGKKGIDDLLASGWCDIVCLKIGCLLLHLLLQDALLPVSQLLLLFQKHKLLDWRFRQLVEEKSTFILVVLMMLSPLQNLHIPRHLHHVG